MLTRSRALSAALTTAALTTAALTLCLAPAVAAPGSTHLGPATAGPSAPRLAAPTLTRLVTSAEDRAPETTGPAQADRSAQIAQAVADLDDLAPAWSPARTLTSTATRTPTTTATPTTTSETPPAPEGYRREGVRLSTGTAQTVLALDPLGDPTTGDGVYAARSVLSSRPVSVEVPHPRSDAWTDLIGTEVFERSGARYLLAAGALRDSGEDADVAHAPDSAFATADRAVVAAGWTVVQVHGFVVSKHPGYPQAVVSAGTASGGPAARAVAARLQAAGFTTCVYDGTVCTDLAARTNVQGQNARAVGADFVHVELERAVRSDPALRSRAAQAIAEAVRGA